MTTALWMLFALSAAVWAADWTGSAVMLLVAVGAAFLGGAYATLTGGPGPEAVGLLVAILALAQVTRRRYGWLGPLVAAAATGCWIVQMRDAGGAPWVALPVASVGPLASAWCARRDSRFASGRIRDEALLLLGGLGLFVAMMPTVVDGWQSAATLATAPVERAPDQTIPLWTMVTVLMALALGGLHAAWRRR